MTRLYADFETDGLFADTIRPGTKDPTIISKVHCLVTQDIDTGEVKRYFDPGIPYEQAPLHADGSLAAGVAILLQADVRSGHSWLGYDERVVREFFPRQYAARRKDATVLDTLVGAKAAWPTEHIKRLDAARVAKARAQGRVPFPGNLVGRHSLESWGRRLGNRKAEYTAGFATFTREMLDYCVQDVSTGVTLFKKLEAKLPLRAWLLEQDFAAEIEKQQRNGFLFDVPAAERLAARLQGRRAEILDELAKTVPAFENTYYTDAKVVANAEARVAMWEQRGNVDKTEKARKNLAEKQAPKVEVVGFNPGSRHHIARHLQERLGWSPTAYTPSGDVEVTEETLKNVQHLPGVPLLVEFLTLNKVLGMLAESKKKDAVPWMKMVGPDGRIHGRVDHNGAVTSRCTHSKPNMTQVPKVGNPFGAECRSLFIAGPGEALVGIDASGLELRMLAHYLAKYDGGEYIEAVCHGDVHTKNRIALEIPDGPTARDTAKRAVYAELYGAGNEKLGWTIDPTGTPAQQAARGRRAKKALLANVKGLRALKDKCALLHEKRGSVNLPDGRRAPTRADYSSLNTLLQASGAVVMKAAVVILNQACRMANFPMRQAHFAHDEIQIEVPVEFAGKVSVLAEQAIIEAGRQLGIRCPLKGEAKIGMNWKETHG